MYRYARNYSKKALEKTPLQTIDEFTYLGVLMQSPMTKTQLINRHVQEKTTGMAAFRNDLIIRGGAPNENRFYIDDIETPSINHFATQGASGGPVGILNVTFIKEVDIFSGAFPASRANALSSVFNFRLRDRANDKFRYTATAGTSDYGLTAEGRWVISQTMCL